MAILEVVTILWLPGVLSSRLLVELVYYGSLLAAGTILGGRLDSASYVPAIAACLALFAVLVCRIFSFAGSASASFNFGPERWLIAIQNVFASTTMLPLDIGAISAAWFASAPSRPHAG